jgi:hypothetical protein
VTALPTARATAQAPMSVVRIFDFNNMVLSPFGLPVGLVQQRRFGSADHFGSAGHVDVSTSGTEDHIGLLRACRARRRFVFHLFPKA